MRLGICISMGARARTREPRVRDVKLDVVTSCFSHRPPPRNYAIPVATGGRRAGGGGRGTIINNGRRVMAAPRSPHASRGVTEGWDLLPKVYRHYLIIRLNPLDAPTFVYYRRLLRDRLN